MVAIVFACCRKDPHKAVVGGSHVGVKPAVAQLFVHAATVSLIACPSICCCTRHGFDYVLLVGSIVYVMFYCWCVFLQKMLALSIMQQSFHI